MKHDGTWREVLISSFRASQRQGAGVLEPASIAGRLLDEANGDASVALQALASLNAGAIAPATHARVRTYLELVESEDT